jgi:hypothetical protein
MLVTVVSTDINRRSKQSRYAVDNAVLVQLATREKGVVGVTTTTVALDWLRKATGAEAVKKTIQYHQPHLHKFRTCCIFQCTGQL